MVSRNICILVLWTKVSSALKELSLYALDESSLAALEGLKDYFQSSLQYEKEGKLKTYFQ